MSNSFSREEISKIMAKATQIQAQMDKYGDHETLSEDELIELGKEVGISKSAIMEAIGQVDATEKKPINFSWLTGTSWLQDIRVLPGTFTDDEWEDIVQEIRASTGGIGKVSQSKSTFEWEQRSREIGYRHLTFTPGKNSTKFTFNYNWRGIKMLMTAVPSVLTMALFSLIGKTIFGADFKAIFILVGLLTGFVGGRIYLHSYFREQKRKLEELSKSIAGIIKRKKKEPVLLDSVDDVYGETESMSKSKNKLQS
ncbi:hypothetical protein EP331_09880 [bacterium]|nr:MAG: hypothetical protein EP331_09880 [bacterium]